MKKTTVPVIVGPTSSGKTSLAINLASQFGSTDIISADSRQVYKLMDIGTGKVPVGSTKPVKKVQDHYSFDGVPVWGYDLIKPNESFTVVDYATYALKKMGELLASRKNVLLVGGTGFYIDVVTQRLKLNGSPPDMELRKELEQKSLSDLLKALTSLNPDTQNLIDTKNKVRVIRAIEREKLPEASPTPLPYLDNVSFKFVGLTSDRKNLYDRVDSWLDTVWKKGLVYEVMRLLDFGYGDARPLKGLIYGTVQSFIKGELSEEEARQRCKYDLHAYIRRQQTWFKKNNEIEWFDMQHPDLVENATSYLDL